MIHVFGLLSFSRRKAAGDIFKKAGDRRQKETAGQTIAYPNTKGRYGYYGNQRNRPKAVSKRSWKTPTSTCPETCTPRVR